MVKKIGIKGYGSVSALGDNANKVWESYKTNQHLLQDISINNIEGIVSALPKNIETKVNSLKEENIKFKSLDKSVLMAIYASRAAIKNSGWKNTKSFGINIGSSRGATNLFEMFYDDFSNHEMGKTHPLTSPTTTLGNLSTWVADDLQSRGINISHSITCSTGLHAVLNGIAWIRSGMADKFLVGATEAANTAFTMAQMQAIKIYAEKNDEYPCRSLDFTKQRNTMCLGEAAAVFCLEAGESDSTIAYIESVGYGTEKLSHNVSVTDDAECFQDSMNMALKEVDGDIDIIVMHAPGTIKGDSSEMNAIYKVFGKEHPAITSNKWKIGHTLGASGSMSMEFAILMLQHQEFIGIPYLTDLKEPKKIERIMVNAVGFGGNAVSIVLKRN